MRFAFEALRTAMRWCPLRVAQALGRMIGAVAYSLLGSYRRLTWAHLRLAFGPRLSEKSQRRIARRVFVGLGKTLMEWLVVDRLSPSQLRRLVEVHGLRHLDQALARGRGVIALSAHVGNWELLAMTLASLGYTGGVLARPLRYPEYEQTLWTMRSRKGVATFPRGSMKEVTRLLRDNQILGMMTDQDTDSLDGVFIEYFGRPAYTPVGPAALSLITGASILPCFLIRMGGRFRLVIEEPIAVARTDDRARDLVDITQAWSRVVESYIRRYPDQWVWMHRRWKTQPREQKAERGRRNEEGGVLQPTPTRCLQPALTALCLLLTAYCLLSVAGCGKSGAPSVNPHTKDFGVGVKPAITSTVEPTEQQQMDAFTVFGYAPDGAKRWELTGRGAVVEGPLVTIKRPDAIGYDVEGQGRTAYLTSSFAQVNQDSRRVRMEHEVTIHTSDGLWLRSPILYWLPDRDEMATDQPVRLETDHMLLRGIGATGHARLHSAKLLHDIEMVLSSSADEQPPTPSEARRSPAPARNLLGGPGGQAGQPVSHVTITCDGPLSFDDERNIALFEVNVHVNDREGDLYSDQLIAYLDGTTRTIRYAEATGHVKIVNGPHTAYSQRAVYEPAKAKVTLLGAPSLMLYPDAPQPPAIPPLMTPGLGVRPLAHDDQPEGYR